MWKRTLSFVLAFVLSLTALCFAGRIFLPDDEAAIGGVPLGAGMSYVRSIYGAPDGRTYGYDSFHQKVTIYNYGKSFFLYAYEGNGQSSVGELLSTADNGLKTPMGVTVGMTEDEVFRIYGQKVPESTSYRTKEYVYTTELGLHIELTMRERKGVYRVSQIHMRYAG